MKFHSSVGKYPVRRLLRRESFDRDGMANVEGMVPANSFVPASR